MRYNTVLGCAHFADDKLCKRSGADYKKVCTWWPILYKREKQHFVFWLHVWKTITLSCYWCTSSVNWKSSFILIYYKNYYGYPNFFLLLLSSFDSIVHLFYIYHFIKKIFCSILFSKFLTSVYILFFVSSSSIADSGTVWLDTFIKIIVICRDINHTLKNYSWKNIIIFKKKLIIYQLANAHSTLIFESKARKYWGYFVVHCKAWFL